MNKVGIGILSHAHGHANTYCRAMQGFNDVELIATWDDNPERGQQAARNFGLEYRHRADDVLDDPRIEAVMINTETNRLPAIELYLDFGFRPDLEHEGALAAWREVKAQLDHPGLDGIE